LIRQPPLPDDAEICVGAGVFVATSSLLAAPSTALICALTTTGW